MIPLGAAVTFRPNKAQGAHFHKFDTPGRTGVFAGYCLKEGSAWNGQYMIFDLQDFCNLPLHAYAAPS
eukprot:3427753-Lingulodinium_polyedra.AAC.1